MAERARRESARCRRDVALRRSAAGGTRSFRATWRLAASNRNHADAGSVVGAGRPHAVRRDHVRLRHRRPDGRRCCCAARPPVRLGPGATLAASRPRWLPWCEPRTPCCEVRTSAHRPRERPIGRVCARRWALRPGRAPASAGWPAWRWNGLPAPMRPLPTSFGPGGPRRGSPCRPAAVMRWSIGCWLPRGIGRSPCCCSTPIRPRMRRSMQRPG